MSFMNKMKDFIGLTDMEEDEDGYEDEYENDAKTEVKPVNPNINSYSKKGNVIKVHSNSDMKLFICEPEKYEDCTRAVDELKNRKAVVLNIENLELEDQRQIFEFIKGAVYALEASIQKVSKGIFVIAPINVQIDGRMEKDRFERNFNYK
ncbi:cell division protein SepF [Sedimentibacter sp. zth1]|uniref:cell division protein SepF n=1 Tax=Sedimentibacter sp. zth1 TaxID=2816908 RepID=UPI001A916F79|nr:cell division protein SepF [Sedimentibacter sp. zth1]QSX06882.1 cell division protein SepF [Sedimentibacter sp. zth1]